MTVSVSRRVRGLGALASFALPAVFVVGFLFLLIHLQQGAEAGMASLGVLLPIGYAFGAGMVASVNPCGFFMLPAYISYQVGVEEAGFDQTSPFVRLVKALVLGATATLGFVVLFAGIGSGIALGGRWLISVFPYAGVAIGVAMLALGGWLLFSHRIIGIMAASRVSVTPRRNIGNVFLFGMGYAICSLSCTLPIFLVVVGSALATQGFMASLGQFVSYALGMGAILVAVTIGAALFRGVVAQWLRDAIPYVHRTSAMFLIAAGGYLLYYWLIYANFFF